MILPETTHILLKIPQYVEDVTKVATVKAIIFPGTQRNRNVLPFVGMESSYWKRNVTMVITIKVTDAQNNVELKKTIFVKDSLQTVH